MEFTGKYKGILKDFGKKATKGEGAEVTKIIIEFRMGPDELAQAIGVGFAENVFGFLIDDEQQGLMWRIKPFTPRGKCPMHVVQISNTKKIDVAPKLAKINPIKGEELVDIDVELQFVLKDDNLVTKYFNSVGTQVTVGLELRDPELPLPTNVTSGPFGNPVHRPAG